MMKTEIKRIFTWCNILLMAVLLAACGGDDDDDNNNDSGPQEVSIVSLQVTSEQANIPQGLEAQLHAEATMSDGSVLDMTSDERLSWSSNDPAIATVSKGLVTGVTPGPVTITASVDANGTTIKGAIELTVTNAAVISLELAPPTASLPVGLVQQFTATALLSDGSSLDVTNHAALNWHSNDPFIATISNVEGSKGMVAGVAPGRVAITASVDANGSTTTAMTELTVTEVAVTGLQLDQTDVSVPVGLTQAFTVKVMLSDGTSWDATEELGLNWSSSDQTIATISNQAGSKGVATGIKPGSVTISASANIDGTPFTTTTGLTVTKALVRSLQVSSEGGSVPVGLPLQFTATALLSDGSSQTVTDHPDLTWVSDNPAIATVSNLAGSKGIVTGLGLGDVTITAVGKINGSEELRATGALTVTNAVVTGLRVSSPQGNSVPAGLNMQLIAEAVLSNSQSEDITSHAGLTWTSSDPAIASVSNTEGSKGLVTGVSKGEVTITASGDIGGTPFSGTMTVTVADAIVTALTLKSVPATNSVPVGLELKFTAEAVLSDGNLLDVTNHPTMAWSSSDTNIVTISKSGDQVLAKGIAEGKATITAAGEANGKAFEATAEVTVTEAIVNGLVVDPDGMSLPLGVEGRAFIAKAVLSSGEVLDMPSNTSLSWAVGDSRIATISPSGVVSGLSLGETTVTASATINGTLFTDDAILKVTDAAVVSLAVSDIDEMVQTFTVQFSATATLTDDTVDDVTADPSLHWTSSNEAIATVSNEAGKKGVVTGIKKGTTQITATGIFNDGETFTSPPQTVVVSLCDIVGVGLDNVGTTSGRIFARPRVECEADGLGMEHKGTTTEGLPYVKMDWAQADASCPKLGAGYRLPTKEELEALYAEHGNMADYAQWPKQNDYWSSSSAADPNYYAVQLAGNGTSGPRHSSTAYYVTCVR